MNFKKQVLKAMDGVRAVPLEYRKYNDLSMSTRVFVDVEADKVEIPHDYKLEHMAFEDFFVSKDVQASPPGEEPFVIKDGLIIHIFRLSSSKIGLSTISINHLNKTYYMTACYELDVESVECKLMWCIPNYRKFALADLERLRLDSLVALVVTASYTREVVESKLPYSIAKLPALERETYKEYIIDLTKPRFVSQVKGGSHASPVEHERRGHYRTSKNGKRYFVRSTIVNEGNTGSVSKEYKFM